MGEGTLAEILPFEAAGIGLEAGAAVGAIASGDVLGGLELGALLAADALLYRNPRSIAGIVPGVVIEENARDELAITEHPVEAGASITDHAYLKPAEVVVRAGWSDCGYGPGYVQAIYAQLLDLQASREPFTLITGKRSYANMLLRSLAQTTDAGTETALMVTAVFQEIIVVETEETTIAPAQRQAQPQTTAPAQESGTVTPKPVENRSLIRMGTDALGFTRRG